MPYGANYILTTPYSIIISRRTERCIHKRDDRFERQHLLANEMTIQTTYLFITSESFTFLFTRFIKRNLIIKRVKVSKMKRTNPSLCANLSGTLGMLTIWTFKSIRIWFIRVSCAVRNQESHTNESSFHVVLWIIALKVWQGTRVNVYMELSKRAHVWPLQFKYQLK